MHKRQGRLVYSPSDLIRFLESPYASFMERLRLEDPERYVRDEVDAQLGLVAAKGDEHEDRYAKALVAEGRDLCEIDDDAEADVDAVANTRAALVAGREFVYQGVLELPPFRGKADFLVRLDERAADGSFLYEVHDAKLAAKPKPYYLVQLCCYAEMLEAMQGTRPERVAVILGTGETRSFRTEDFRYHYLAVKAAFLEQMAAFRPDAEPPLPDPRADHKPWQSRADAYLEQVDHLVRVAGISSSQIRKLHGAGIETMTALARTDTERVPRIDNAVFARLKQQARLQVDAPPEPPPPYELVPQDPDDERRGFATLPPPSPGDIFFDLEGYPLADDGGLEYLFGATHLVDGEPAFKDFWAFDDATEQEAFEQVIDWIIERWRADPQMHVYHYAPYEPTAMKRLMGRYGTREEEVDHLLRQGVFVDLYRVVREGVRIGEPSYSLKQVERLYMQREGEVESAGESIVQFAAWLNSDESRDWRQSPILKGIRDYNEDDCISTWKLAEWLWERQAEFGPVWMEPHAPKKKQAAEHDRTTEEFAPLREEDRARRELADRLLAGLPGDSATDSDDQRIQRLLAQMLEFHRRADKPMWWNYFERDVYTSEEHAEEITCLGDVVRDGAPRPVRRSQCCAYRFDAEQVTKIAEGKKVCFAGIRHVLFSVESLDQDAGRIELTAGGKTLEKTPDGTFPPAGSLLLYEHVAADTMADSLLRVAKAWNADGSLPPALHNLLLRRPPALIEGSGSPAEALLRDDEDSVDGTHRVVAALDGATLSVQGPPGSGKTYTGSRVIARLLADGKNIGVVSNSHKSIIKLLDEVRDVMGDAFRCLKAGDDPNEPLFDHPGAAWVKMNAKAADAYTGGLIGGTAWLFSRSDMHEELDYLFVDEAGQVSLANLVAMAPSARNLVLLGDQMQLGQPTQGTHPGESGASALEFALAGHATVPPELGIFLGTTWRLHPDLCRFISGGIYEGRLEPEQHTVRRVIRVPDEGGRLVPVEAGLLFSPVEHEGNTQASDEEVERVAALVDELLGRERTDEHGRPAGPVTIEHILFVTPYNLQVQRLRQRLPAGARVASVDKFQGQEAPIVIVSLCTSFGETGGRGLAFVLDRNRLNVALSRAQSLAIVVGDPRIARTDVGSIAEMERVNLFCRVVREGMVECGTHRESAAGHGTLD